MMAIGVFLIGAVDMGMLQNQVLFLQAPGKTDEVTLKAHFGPGDDGELVVTIMLPDED